MRMQLLIDSNEFWSTFQKDVRASRDYVYIQALSFEGDRVGKMVSDELLSSRSRDVRVLVDFYTKYVISDRFMYWPRNYLDSDLRMERASTLKMLEELDRSGIQVKFTNPVGFLLTKFPARDHKKMALIDDHISYIGGINFSDHNFEWHDLMVRIDDPEITAFLKKDFLSSWQGFHENSRKTIKDVQLYIYDGYSNERNFQTIFRIIEKAQRSIFIESPYISFPFYEKLRAARERGVETMLIAPGKNNRKNMARYTLWEAKRSGVDLWLYEPGMTHVKAMLVDDNTLVLGSTNFDYISYRAEQELISVIKEEGIVSDFKKRLVGSDLQKSRKFDGEVNYQKGFFHYLGLKALGKTLVFLAKL